MDPAGKVALVTGGGSGIGRATAHLFAVRGAVVYVADVDDAGGTETVETIEAHGGRGRYVHTDVSSVAGLEALFETILSETGAVHVVHNNAGLVSGAPDFPDTTPTRIAAVVGVNVTGVFAGTVLAIQAMSQTGGGVVVNTASSAASAKPGDVVVADPVYAATKAAVMSFTQLCAPLAARSGVRVNAILPGAVDTSIIAKTGDGNEPASWLKPHLQELRLILPAEVAEVVVSLVEDETCNGAAVAIANS